MRLTSLALVLCLAACKKDPATLTAPVARVLGPTVISLPRTRDGWTIKGTFYTGEESSRAVILVHQLGSSRAEWGPLVQRLSAPPAVTVLAIDLRGHGESTRDPRGVDTAWPSFGSDSARWAASANDVSAAIEYLQASGVRQIAVVGSSIGGSASALASSGELDRTPGAPPPGVTALGLLSPGVAYHGVEISTALRGYLRTGAPVLMFAGSGDPESAEAMNVLLPAQHVGVERAVFASAAHGVALCNEDPTRWDRLGRWVRTVLGIQQVRPIAPSLAVGSGSRDR